MKKSRQGYRIVRTLRGRKLTLSAPPDADAAAACYNFWFICSVFDIFKNQKS